MSHPGRSPREGGRSPSALIMNRTFPYTRGQPGTCDRWGQCFRASVCCCNLLLTMYATMSTYKIHKQWTKYTFFRKIYPHHTKLRTGRDRGSAGFSPILFSGEQIGENALCVVRSDFAVAVAVGIGTPHRREEGVIICQNRALAERQVACVDLPVAVDVAP